MPNKLSLWTKKVDDMHISGEDYNTLCGRPRLGNNYSNMFPDRKMCSECEKKQAEREQQ